MSVQTTSSPTGCMAFLNPLNLFSWAVPADVQKVSDAKGVWETARLVKFIALGCFAFLLSLPFFSLQLKRAVCALFCYVGYEIFRIASNVLSILKTEKSLPANNLEQLLLVSNGAPITRLIAGRFLKKSPKDGVNSPHKEDAKTITQRNEAVSCKAFCLRTKVFSPAIPHKQSDIFKTALAKAIQLASFVFFTIFASVAFISSNALKAAFLSPLTLIAYEVLRCFVNLMNVIKMSPEKKPGPLTMSKVVNGTFLGNIAYLLLQSSGIGPSQRVAEQTDARRETSYHDQTSDRYGRQEEGYSYRHSEFSRRDGKRGFSRVEEMD